MCVYCLNDVPIRNWDHVMPLSWYPDTTPANLERWKIPSCVPCNSDHGRNEEDLLLRLMMCFGNDDARAAGIPQRIIRSMNPSHATSARDRRARLARFRAVGRDMIRGSARSGGESIIPNFGREESGASETRIMVSGEWLGKLAEKIVRGFVYLQRQELIRDDHRIEWFLLEDNSGAYEIMRAATVYSVGPGIIVRYLHTGESAVASAFIIEIWNRLKLYATVNPPE